MNFKGPARRLTSQDITRIADTLGCGEDELHAVMDVEAAGSGFDGQGRPKMLFEPHLFWRALKGEKRARAEMLGIAYPKWKPGAYPKDSYGRLASAMVIDESAALSSASWGLGQVLGSNFKACGYASPKEMVKAFVESEANQLQGMARFIKAHGLDKHMRAHNWAKFAEGYNGPAYRKNNYDGKLAAAYEKWRRIKDTPAVSAPIPDIDHELVPTIEPPAKPKGRAAETTGAVIVGTAGGGAVIAAQQSGFSTLDVVMMAIGAFLAVVIAVAIIRHLKKG